MAEAGEVDAAHRIEIVRRAVQADRDAAAVLEFGDEIQERRLAPLPFREVALGVVDRNPRHRAPPRWPRTGGGKFNGANSPGSPTLRQSARLRGGAPSISTNRSSHEYG